MNPSRAVDLAPIAERAARTRDGFGINTYTATDGRDILYNDPDGWEVEQPWLWWVAGGDGFPPALGNPPPGARGGWVSSLASLPGVTRVTTIVAETLAALPWVLRRGDERLETPEWIADPQALRLDARTVDVDRAPDVRLDRVSFWTQWVADAFWLGDGFVWVPVRDEAGQPRPPIWLLDPFFVTVEDDRYYYGNDENPLEAGSVLHLRGYPPYTDGRGTGMLLRHSADLALGIMVRGYAAGQFRSGVPSGYLKLQAANVTKEQAEQVRGDWMAQHGRRRGIAVLSAMADFQAISVRPVDAQLDKQREWTLRDIALAGGVPPYMLGIPGDSSTYANVESRMIELTRFTHIPWARRIEAVLDAQVPRGQEFKINLDALLRGTTRERYETYAVGLDKGFLTLEEVRELEDRPPLPDPIGGAVG